jgi:hypothetical protein
MTSTTIVNMPADLDPLGQRIWLRERRQALLDHYEETLKRAIDEDRDVSDLEQRDMNADRAEVEKIDARIAEIDRNGQDALAARLAPPAHKEETRAMRTTALRSTAISSPAIHSGQTRRYSVTRAVQFAHGDAERDDVDAGLEKEFDQEMRRRGFQTRHGGFWISYAGALDEAGYVRRDISSAPGGGAAALASIKWRPDLFTLTVDALRPTLPTAALGVRTYTSTQPLMHIPTQLTALGELQMLPIDAAPAPGTDITTRLVEKPLRTGGMRQTILRHGVNYSEPSLVGLYARQMVEAVGRGIARQFFYGRRDVANPNACDGLITEAGLQRFNFGTGGNPAHVSWPALIDMAGRLSGLPVDGGPTRQWLMSPLLEESMMELQKKFRDPADGAIPDEVFWFPIISDSTKGTLAGKLYQTNPGIPITAARVTHLWLGDWSEDYIIIYGPGVEILPDPFTTPGARTQWCWVDFNVGTHDARRHVLAEDALLTQSAAPVVPLIDAPPEAKPGNVRAKAAATA